jgi:hypothetical protein
MGVVNAQIDCYLMWITGFFAAFFRYLTTQHLTLMAEVKIDELRFY